jgi:hypothetical protein
LEQIICQLYVEGIRPRAFTTRLEEAIACVLACGMDNVKKLRKAISACRRGKRSEVAWLRPPVR